MELDKSLKQLEKDVWEEPEKFTTGLMQRCYKYRKVPISSLKAGEIRTLISQDIGTKFLLTRVLQLLSEDILIEGDLYEGDLLEVTLKINWNIDTSQQLRYKELVLANQVKIKEVMGSSFLKQANGSNCSIKLLK